jgi:hypothetical protein
MEERERERKEKEKHIIRSQSSRVRSSFSSTTNLVSEICADSASGHCSRKYLISTGHLSLSLLKKKICQITI